MGTRCRWCPSSASTSLMTTRRHSTSRWLPCTRWAALLAAWSSAYSPTFMVAGQSFWFVFCYLDYVAHLWDWGGVLPGGAHLPSLPAGQATHWHQCGRRIHCHFHCSRLVPAASCARQSRHCY
jgi:hypothetical protein